MDRRGFLKVLGVGGTLAVAAPQLVLAAATKVALPERRVFVPPTNGWLSWGKDESALAYVRRIPGRDGVLYVDEYVRHESPRWTLDIERFSSDLTSVPSFDGPTQIGGVEGWLQSWDHTSWGANASTIHERYTGFGVPPNLADLGYRCRSLRIEYPSVPAFTQRW